IPGDVVVARQNARKLVDLGFGGHEILCAIPWCHIQNGASHFYTLTLCRILRTVAGNQYSPSRGLWPARFKTPQISVGFFPPMYISTMRLSVAFSPSRCP